MITKDTEPKYGWGVFEAGEGCPVREVIPLSWDEGKAEGHIFGLTCPCQPFYDEGESEWLQAQVILVHRMLMSDFPEDECNEDKVS